MGQNMIQLYYDFATRDTPTFGGFAIKQSVPDECQYLQIFSNEKFSMKMIDENFGNVKFWEKMESTLLKAGKHNDEL
jgi:hypothetical protein